MPYMYKLKVKKFWVCAYLRLDSIKENIEGDANLHHPPRNRVNMCKPHSYISRGQKDSVLFPKTVLSRIFQKFVQISFFFPKIARIILYPNKNVANFSYPYKFVQKIFCTPTHSTRPIYPLWKRNGPLMTRSDEYLHTQSSKFLPVYYISRYFSIMHLFLPSTLRQL